MKSLLKSKSKATIPTVEQFELPSLPRAALKVVSLIQDPEVDLPTLGKAIELDPALASRLVRLSNSSLFGLSREISSVRQAMVILGLRTVKMAALSFTLLPAIPTSKQDERTLAACWRRLLTNAMACRLLAKLFAIDQEEAFLAGLLQDIGLMVFAHGAPREYGELLEDAQLEEAPSLVELEREIFGGDHAAIGAKLLERWSLPVALVDAVRRHHEVTLTDDLANHERDLAMLLSVADSVTEFLLNPTNRNLERFTDLSIYFGESTSEVDQFVQRLEMQVQELAGMLDLKLPEGDSYESVLARARDLSRNFKVLHREALPLRLRQELSMARRQDWCISIVLVQARNAQRLDKENKESARAALVDQIGQFLQESCRDCDSLFRLSTDIFAILAPNTALEGATTLIQRLVPRLTDHAIVVDGKKVPADSVFGVVCVNPREDDLDVEMILRTAVNNLKRSWSSKGLAHSTI